MTLPDGSTGEQPAVTPSVTTAPAPGRPHGWWSAIPRHLGRARTSTVVLGILFLAVFALYLNVRPDPVATTGGTTGGTEQAPTTGGGGTTAPTTTVPPSTTTTPPTTTTDSTTTETTEATSETVPEETTETTPLSPELTSEVPAPTTASPTG